MQHFKDPVIFLSFISIFSLLIGSFLNVIRVRLPKLLINLWQLQCKDNLEILDAISTNSSSLKTKQSSFFRQRSFCQACDTTIAWFDNIPILSFIALRGKCRHCKQSISLHYPLLEIITPVCSFLVAKHFGFSIQTIFTLLLTWILIVQAWIDLEHTFLPDEITLPCLWLGLIINCFYVFIDPTSAILGAVIGYLSLYTIYKLFKIFTGKDGMGDGDFKLLAMIGAWLGWQQLPFIIIVSSCLGSIVGLSLIALKKKTLNSKLPFGPYLAIASWLALFSDHLELSWL